MISERHPRRHPGGGLLRSYTSCGTWWRSGRDAACSRAGGSDQACSGGRPQLIFWRGNIPISTSAPCRA